MAHCSSSPQPPQEDGRIWLDKLCNSRMLCEHSLEFLFRGAHRREWDAATTGVAHSQAFTATESSKLIVLHTSFELHDPIERVCVDPGSRYLQVPVTVIDDRDSPCRICLLAPSQA